MCENKIVDSSREFISSYGFGLEKYKHLGFVAADPDEPTDEEGEVIEALDEFIQKISTMLTSLLEGKEDRWILQKISFSLQIPELRKRMMNVFGSFI